MSLSDITITDIRETRDDSLCMTVKTTQTETLCRYCQSLTELYGYGRTLTLRHLSILSREVYIKITPPRGICKHCDDHPTTTQTLSWFQHNGHQTKPYDDYLMLQLIGSTQADIAKKENLTEEILQSAIDRYQFDKVDWKTIKRIGLLGIDEISKKKGHKDYVTLITSRHKGTNKILAVIDGKEKASIKAFLKSIPKKKRKTITAVCVDLCDNYINAAKEVLGKNNPVVANRFHVAKLYRKAMTELRSSELKQLKKELSEEDYQLLCPAIKILINRDTSGWVEGINNKVKVIKRRCYGITNLKHFFQRIFLDLQGYDIFLPIQRAGST